MSSDQSAKHVIDLDDVKLIKDAKPIISYLYNVTITFDDSSPKDGKQLITMHGAEDELTLAKDYIDALCSPSEKAELKYPPELKHVLDDKELHCQIERDAKVVLHHEEAGRITIRGHDPVSVAIAYSVLEEAINKHFDLATAELASKSTDSKLRDTIKHVVFDELNWKEESAYLPHQKDESELGKNVNNNSDLTAESDPGKYLKEFALSQGYDEEKVESIFAHFGRNMKFEVFFRVLKNIITIPKN